MSTPTASSRTTTDRTTTITPRTTTDRTTTITPRTTTDRHDDGHPKNDDRPHDDSHPKNDDRRQDDDGTSDRRPGDRQEPPPPPSSTDLIRLDADIDLRSDTDPERADPDGPLAPEDDDALLHAATTTVDLYVGQFADEPFERDERDAALGRPWISATTAFGGETPAPTGDEPGYGGLDIENLSDLLPPEAARPLPAHLREQPTIDIEPGNGSESDLDGATNGDGPTADQTSIDPEATLEPGALASLAEMAATTIDLSSLDPLHDDDTGANRGHRSGNGTIDDDRPTALTDGTSQNPEKDDDPALVTLNDVSLPLVEPPDDARPSDTDSSPGQNTVVFYADDETHIFPDTTDEPETIGTDDTDRQPRETVAAASAAAAMPPFGPLPTGGAGEEIPFPTPSVRYGVEHVSLIRRLAIRAEVAWFNSRRRLSNLAAVLGVLAIAAIAVYFGARELQRESVETDRGLPITPTTTTEPRASRNAPVITDLPDTNPTTTRAPARRASTTRPPTTVAPTTAAPTTTTTEAPTTTEEEETTTTRRRFTTRPTTTVAPTTETTAEQTTTTRRRPNTTRRTTTTRATTTEPPTTVDETTTTEDPEEDDPPVTEAEVEQLPFVAPPSIDAPRVAELTSTSASVTYTSDRCVATRFVLAGDDGSRLSGSSPEFDPTISCSTAWNLDFSGSNDLSPGTGYSLTVWVRAEDSGLTANSRVTFRTPT